MDLNWNFGQEEPKKEPEKKTLKESLKAFPKNVKNFPSTIVYKIKHFDKEQFKKDCIQTLESLQTNYKTLLGTVIAAVILMFAVCWIVFFAAVRTPEQVMVPNVVGKELTNALLEMQAKELYPKIQLRYTDNADDAGTILNQNPEGGAIVKAGRRITLTVSRGAILDHVENYIGQNFDEVKINLQTMFTGSKRPLIVLDEPSYKADQSEAGTILAQDPPEGTNISNPVTVKLIVSRGPEYENTRVPNIVGMSVESVLKIMESSKLVFEFTSRPADKNEEPSVVSQQAAESDYVANYTRVYGELALPSRPVDDKYYGLFTANLPSYPYPVEMTLDSVGTDGRTETIVSFKHTGGNVTIPYISEKGCELVLNVAGKKTVRKMVE